MNKKIPDNIYETRCQWCEFRQGDENEAVPDYLVLAPSHHDNLPCSILSIARWEDGECCSFHPNYVFGICLSCVHRNTFFPENCDIGITDKKTVFCSNRLHRNRTASPESANRLNVTISSHFQPIRLHRSLIPASLPHLQTTAKPVFGLPSIAMPLIIFRLLLKPIRPVSRQNKKRCYNGTFQIVGISNRRIVLSRDQKQKEEAIQLTGIVTEEVRGAFRVKLDDMDHIVLCRLAGKMRKFRIRVVPGDHVQVEISPYDMDRGRIIYRER